LLNTSDEVAEKYIKYLLFYQSRNRKFGKKRIKKLPHLRVLQKRLADEVTVMVHSPGKMGQWLIKASDILFWKNSTSETLKKLMKKHFGCF